MEDLARKLNAIYQELHQRGKPGNQKGVDKVRDLAAKYAKVPNGEMTMLAKLAKKNDVAAGDLAKFLVEQGFQLGAGGGQSQQSGGAQQSGELFGGQNQQQGGGATPAPGGALSGGTSAPTATPAAPAAPAGPAGSSLLGATARDGLAGSDGNVIGLAGVNCARGLADRDGNARGGGGGADPASGAAATPMWTGEE